MGAAGGNGLWGWTMVSELVGDVNGERVPLPTASGLVTSTPSAEAVTGDDTSVHPFL